MSKISSITDPPRQRLEIYSSVLNALESPLCPARENLISGLRFIIREHLKEEPSVEQVDAVWKQIQEIILPTSK